MSEIVDNEPKVTVDVSLGEQIVDSDDWGTFVHVDELSEPYPSSLHIYIFSSEFDSDPDNINEIITELREQYVFSQGVVFPDWMRAYTDELTDKQFYYVFQYGMFQELTEEVVQQIQREIAGDSDE